MLPKLYQGLSGISLSKTKLSQYKYKTILLSADILTGKHTKTSLQSYTGLSQAVRYTMSVPVYNRKYFNTFCLVVISSGMCFELSIYYLLPHNRDVESMSFVFGIS